MSFFSLPGCDALVNHFAFFPDRRDVLPAEDLPAGVEEVYIETGDGVRIHSLYLPVAGSDKVVIYFHGNAGNVYHRLPGLFRMRDAGASVIGVSYRGYGKSAGKPSEKGLYLDGEAAFRYATETLGLAPDRVIVFGRSIGTSVAIRTVQNRNVAGLILVTPLTSGKALARAGGLRMLAPLAGNAFDNLAWVKQVKAPVLVIHGTQDRIVPYAMGRQLYENIDTEKRFVSIEGGGHNDLQDVFAGAYWPPIIEFIRRQ